MENYFPLLLDKGNEMLQSRKLNGDYIACVDSPQGKRDRPSGIHGCAESCWYSITKSYSCNRQCYAHNEWISEGIQSNPLYP